jgi:outer membrane murein-binding lipoprotein Lpp
MKKLFVILAIAGVVIAAGAVLGCGKIGGVDSEVITDLQDRVETLEADVEAVAVTLTELQDEYDEHMEKQHGTKPAERKPVVTTGGERKPPTRK